MPKRLQTTSKKLLLWLIPLVSLGLSGFHLLRKVRKPNKFDLLDNTKFSSLKPFVIAQSKVESANYTSDLFKRANNAFGMKNANFRSQLGKSVPGTDYRYYNSLEDSIKDFVLYLDYVNFPIVSDVNSYVRNLKERNYFESDQTDYINALKSWL